MALAYRPPGTSIEEIVTPTIAPLLATPTSLCLIGVAQGFITRTDQVALTGTTAVPLPGLPTGATLSTVTSVKDALDPTKGAANGSGYTLTTDYTVQTAAGTVTRVAAGGIADGRLVNVTYQYLPSDYYEAYRLTSLNAIEQRYGSAYTSDGTQINSYLSFAASVAFENGASDVVCQPLFIRATPGDTTTAKTQPTATQAAATSAWQDTLFALRDIEDVNIIVPIVGQSHENVGDAQQLAILQTVQDHVWFMRGEDQFIIGIFGEDSSASTTVATRSTLQTHAATLKSRYSGAIAEQTVLVSATRASRALPALGRSHNVGGQYIAAAVAGSLAPLPISATLTRRGLSGFNSLTESPVPTKSEKNQMGQAGIFVVETVRGQILCRHAITLDDTNSARRELSVVRAKHYMLESVRDTIERQIIGQVPADGNAPFLVRSTVISVLEQLRQGRALVDYGAVQARQKSYDPTVVEVRFSYRPAFPLNFVEIVFSIDLTSGVTPVDETLPSV
jgi:hypothetical protein